MPERDLVVSAVPRRVGRGDDALVQVAAVVPGVSVSGDVRRGRIGTPPGFPGWQGAPRAA
ncbi:MULTISPECIES: hypothetical protein [unclassified Streptomyces]|uniref:hypothetical protein n=1 Tax=unclassified Streptomyces TaxID=2593676 RepID=UPI0036E16A5C